MPTRVGSTCCSAAVVPTNVAHELADADKVEVLRAYLSRWELEVGRFFDGVDASSSDEALLGIAPNHPVLRLDAAG